MASAPKAEDFPTIDRWLEALEKFGATQKEGNPKTKTVEQVKKVDDPTVQKLRGANGKFVFNIY